jgi:hypothetical protein
VFIRTGFLFKKPVLIFMVMGTRGHEDGVSARKIMVTGTRGHRDGISTRKVMVTGTV